MAVMLGRLHERLTLDGTLADAREGRSRVLVLDADPGMGKSTLVEYVAEQAAGDFVVLRDTGSESEVGLSYGGLARLLRPVSAKIDSIDRPMASLLRVLMGRGEEADTIRDRFAPGLATLALLAAIAEGSPLLVIVDDLQWVDEASVDALVFVARRLEAEGIVMVLTRRSGTEPRDLAALPHLHIGGLDDESAGLLLRRRSATLPEDRVRFLVEATGGNPLALEELPMLLESEKLAGTVPLSEPLPLPSRLEDTFALRISALGRRTQEALTVAAILDRPDGRLLDIALSHVEREIEDLADAEDAGLVDLSAVGVRFRHPLVRSAVTQRATPSWRRRAHRAVAAALSEQNDPASQAGRVWHLAEGCIGLDDEIADLLDRMAQDAARIAGFASASHAFERSSQLTRDVSRRNGRLLAAAEAAYQAGDGRRATRLLAAVDAAVSEPDGSVEQVRLHGRLDMWQGLPDRAYDRLSAAAAAIAVTDAVGGAELLLDAVLASAFSGLVERTYQAALQARAYAANDVGAVGLVARLAVGAGHLLRGDTAEGLAILNDDADRLMLALAARAPDALHWISSIAYCRLVADMYDRSDRLAEAVIAAATRDGAVAALPFVLTGRAFCRWRTGQWDAAAAIADQAAVLAAETSRVMDLAYALAVLALVRAGQGRQDDCQKLANQSLDHAGAAAAHTTEINAYVALGILHLGHGQPGDALDPLQEAQALSTKIGHPAYTHWHWASELVEAHARLGHPDRAAEAVELLVNYAQRNPTPAARLFSARALGLVASEDSFHRHMEQAIGFAAATGRPFETARTELCYGERLRRQKQKAEARTHLQVALNQFTLLGADAFAQRARAEIEATGQTPTEMPTTLAGRLTAQEMQVALAAATGASNREIAGRVFLSTKTVEYHLTHVYRKLNITNRQQLSNTLVEATRLTI
jgi:DNA-binding NarL/FixJ family response regulator